MQIFPLNRVDSEFEMLGIRDVISPQQP